MHADKSCSRDLCELRALTSYIRERAHHTVDAYEQRLEKFEKGITGKNLYASDLEELMKFDMF